MVAHPHQSIVTIESSDGTKFRTPRNIFQLQIPNLFCPPSNSYERPASIHLKVKFDSSTVGALLHFVYTDELVTPTLELFKLACQWKMTRLMAICGNRLANHLTIENAVGTLIIADEWGAPQLQWAAEKFIGTSASRMILESRDRQDIKLDLGDDDSD